MATPPADTNARISRCPSAELTPRMSKRANTKGNNGGCIAVGAREPACPLPWSDIPVPVRNACRRLLIRQWVTMEWRPPSPNHDEDHSCQNSHKNYELRGRP